jgi:hypothetical protein
MNLYPNPLGRRTPKAALVRMGRGKMVHVKHPEEPGTLCAPVDGESKRWTANLREVHGEVVTCYRCLKLMAMNESLRGDPLSVGGDPNQRLLRQAFAGRAR